MDIQSAELGGGYLGQRRKPLVKSFAQMGREYMGPDFSMSEVMDGLQKALFSGAGASPTVTAGFGGALLLENLDNTMTKVLYESSHLKMFNSIPRVPSAQALYQWIRQHSRGGHRGAVGFAEGGAPKSGVSRWARGSMMNKYMGVRRGVTHQMMVTGQMGGAFVDPVQSENENGTLQLLEMIERRLIWGQANILSDAGADIHYDGLYAQLNTAAVGSVIDKEGNPLDFEDLENYGERLVTVGKLLNFDNLRSYATPRVLSDLGKLKLQAERIILGGNYPAGYRPGVPLDGYRTQRGLIPFEDSIFTEAVEGNIPLATADAGALAASAGASGVASSDTTSKIPAGTFIYHVSTLNDAGESLVVSSTGVVATAGQKITVTITGVANSTGYRVYRQDAGTSAAALGRWVADVPSNGASNVDFVDRNEIRPNCGVMAIMNMSEPDIAIAQMSPMIKWPLAITNTTVEFLILCYHVLAVKAAERVVFVKNIGQRS